MTVLLDPARFWGSGVAWLCAGRLPVVWWPVLVFSRTDSWGLFINVVVVRVVVVSRSSCRGALSLFGDLRYQNDLIRREVEFHACQRSFSNLGCDTSASTLTTPGLLHYLSLKSNIQALHPDLDASLYALHQQTLPLAASLPRISLSPFASLSHALKQLPAHLLLSFVPLLPSQLLTQAVLHVTFRTPSSPLLEENVRSKTLVNGGCHRHAAGPVPGVALDVLPHPRRVRHVLVTAACQHGTTYFTKASRAELNLDGDLQLGRVVILPLHQTGTVWMQHYSTCN